MKVRIIVLAGMIFAAGVITGFFVSHFPKEKPVVVEKSESKQIRETGKYQFINPLLECEVAEGSIDARKENFHDDLESFVGGLQEKYALTEAAVYFRDLNNGPTFGVNTEGEFFPASLLKVPVMMAYYHWAESEPNLLDAEMVYEIEQNFNLTPTVVSGEELVLGETYTVAELIRRMIIYSDNQALGLLVNQLPLERMQDLFQLLGVGEDVLENPDAKLSIKEYAGFFRILFNSSYLSRDHSEKALSLLASTDFNDGLVAGIPEGVTVAHKFGEAGTGDVERQLHDCGIVYFPNHPYLACIMTRGRDTESLKQTLHDISRFIYEKIDQQY